MCVWECSGCWRGHCRVIRGARCALDRSVIEGYLIRWFVSISRVFLFDTRINCFLLLLLLCAFWASNGMSTEGTSQALQKIVPRPT